MAEEPSNEREEQLSAYLDGELSDEERAEVEAYLASNEQARQRLAELRRMSALLQKLPRRRAPSDLLDSITTQLERRELLAGTLPPDMPPSTLSRRIGRWVASAAVVFLAATAGYMTYRHVRQRSARPEGVPVAVREEPAPAGEPAEPPREFAKKTPAPAHMPLAKSAESAKPAEVPGPRLAKVAPVGVGQVRREAAARPATQQAPAPTFEELLLANASTARLVRQPFDREPLQITVWAENAAARRRLARRIEEFFHRNRITNIRMLPPSAHVPPDHQVYLPAEPGVNTSPDRASRYLSRVTVAQLSNLLDELQPRQIAPLRFAERPGERLAPVTHPALPLRAGDRAVRRPEAPPRLGEGGVPQARERRFSKALGERFALGRVGGEATSLPSGRILQAQANQPIALEPAQRELRPVTTRATTGARGYTRAGEGAATQPVLTQLAEAQPIQKPEPEAGFFWAVEAPGRRRSTAAREEPATAAPRPETMAVQSVVQTMPRSERAVAQPSTRPAITDQARMESPAQFALPARRSGVQEAAELITVVLNIDLAPPASGAEQVPASVPAAEETEPRQRLETAPSDRCPSGP